MFKLHRIPIAVFRQWPSSKHVETSTSSRASSSNLENEQRSSGQNPAFEGDAAIQEAAWSGYIADGVICEAIETLRAGYTVQQQSDIPCSSDDLIDRLQSLGAELNAFVEEPIPEPPTPKILGTLGSVIPFTKGARNHG